jgi:hypothetical protein
MAKNDDVQLVESISGIDGTPLTLDVQDVYIHGSIGVSSNVATSNLVAVIVVSNSTKVEMQQLIVIQAQVIAWKPHS